MPKSPRSNRSGHKNYITAVELLSRPSVSIDGASTLTGIDWLLLRRQKMSLIRAVAAGGIADNDKEKLNGLINFLDVMTDAAEDCGLL